MEKSKDSRKLFIISALLLVTVSLFVKGLTGALLDLIAFTLILFAVYRLR
ncbi:hypothetical protein [Photobacterium damselae]|nr:hypothetical protein [Photobacterium damselae]MCG3815629.1 hypothetical protein [Photobacterium damselae]SUB90302.1 Uncharacterised protein [Photobacterium damselae]